MLCDARYLDSVKAAVLSGLFIPGWSSGSITSWGVDGLDHNSRSLAAPVSS